MNDSAALKALLDWLNEESAVDSLRMDLDEPDEEAQRAAWDARLKAAKQVFDSEPAFSRRDIQDAFNEFTTVIREITQWDGELAKQEARTETFLGVIEKLHELKSQ